MRSLAFLLVASGVAALLFSCTIDTGVETASGGRVVNLQRIAWQASTERWGFGLLIVGVLVYGAARRNAPPPERDVDRTMPSSTRREDRFTGSKDLPPT